MIFYGILSILTPYTLGEDTDRGKKVRNVHFVLFK